MIFPRFFWSFQDLLGFSLISRTFTHFSNSGFFNKVYEIFGVKCPLMAERNECKSNVTVSLDSVLKNKVPLQEQVD